MVGWACSLTLVLVAAEPAAPGAPSHPSVFLTAADVARVQKAVAFEPAFARWADALVRKAEGVQLESLPPLTRAWWDNDRAKPWMETYPQVFHHTWIVPQRWSHAALACAGAQLVRPSPSLAEKGKRLLLSLSDFTYEFEHYDVGLNYTVWSVEAMEAYDILFDRFTEAERRRIDAGFERFLAAVEKNDAYWLKHEPGGGLNNHYAWHKLCFLAVGAFYHRPALIDRALDGPRGIEHLLRHGLIDEGLWREGSIPYQFAATIPMVKAAELLENIDHPRKLYRGDRGDGRTIEAAYGAVLPLLFPDRKLPTIGDCYGDRPHLGRNPDWETLYRRFGDPRFAWLLRDAGRRPEALFSGVAQLPAGAPPAMHSRLWPEHGYAALRSVEGPDYWTGRGWTLFATYSDNLVHENADKLSIQLFADGHLWLPDCEALPGEEHSFSSQIQRQLNRHTLCHNLVMVDDAPQRHPDRQLDLLEYHVLPQVKRVSIGDLSGRLYPGVSQLRTCIVRPEYVLDFYQVQAAAPRRLAWTLHVDGQPTQSSHDARPASEAFPKSVPWTYLRTPEKGHLAGTYWEVFRRGAQTFRVDLACSGPQELVRCGFPKTDHPGSATTPMRLFRSQSRDAWYAAVYRSGGTLDAPAHMSVAEESKESRLVRVELDGRTLEHRIPLLSTLSRTTPAMR